MTENDLPGEAADPIATAHDLMERGIASAESGDLDAALAHLSEAERLATEAGDPELASAALINQGYAYTVAGDHRNAVRRYVDAAEVARDTENPERLKAALANAAVEFQALGSHAEAIAALSEYLELLGDGDREARVRALLNRAISLAEADERDASTADLAEADRLSSEAETPALVYIVRMNQGFAYVREHDPAAALMVFEDAVRIARELNAGDALLDAIMSVAQTHRALDQLHEADSRFIELEELCRERREMYALADALYWHGLVLRALKRPRHALALWREEADLRRSLRQEGPLGDSLLQQADVLRALGDHEAADPLYREAEEIYRRVGWTAALANALYSHAASLWTTVRPHDALECATEAAAVAAAEGDAVIQRRAEGLRAMALADLGDIEGAGAALDRSCEFCERTGAHAAMVWVIARRAYVMARDERPVEDVIEQLRAAYAYALEHDQLDAAGIAVRKIVTHIASRCDERYHEPAEELVRQLSADMEDIAQSGLPAAMFAVPAPQDDAGHEAEDEPVAEDESAQREWLES